MRKRIFLVIYIFLFFILLEILLRMQQKLGPIYDLEFNQIINGYELSDILNHRNPLGEHQLSITLGNTKMKYKRCFDQNGVRINKFRPRYPDDQAICKVLFMGDSFMEGFDDAHTIPQYIWQNFQRTHLRNLKMNFLNAGCSSYSPAIYIPQVKLLIPQLRPDLVVIDIDETDLMDDYIRYKDLIVRDDRGDIIAVKPTPINCKFIAGFIKIKKYPLYVIRLPLKLYHTRISMPLAIRDYRKKYPRDVLDPQSDRDKDVIKKYAQEIDFFKKNLTELVRTLINLMQDKRRIIFIYHSYLFHLKGDSNGFYANTLVPDILKGMLDEYQISFYDATEDLKKSFANAPEKYYISGDIFGHFNFAGMAIYSDFVAQRLLPLVEAIINEKKRI